MKWRIWWIQVVVGKYVHLLDYFYLCLQTTRFQRKINLLSHYSSEVTNYKELSILYFPTFFFLLLSLHFNTNICNFYSSHFQNRFITLFWEHLKGIMGYFDSASLHVAFSTSKDSRSKTDTDREGDWNGEKRHVSVSYLQRPCSLCVLLLSQFAAVLGTLHRPRMWLFDILGINYLCGALTNS